MKNVIITGPTGAIGLALIEKCLKEGCQVTAVVRPDSQRLGVLPKDPALEIIGCDLTDYAGLAEKLPKKSYDVFYHMAWGGTSGAGRNDMELQLMNLDAAMHAVEAAKKVGCRKFVGLGSQAEYGRVQEKLTAETRTMPENAYGQMKLATAMMTLNLCNERGLEHNWVRVLSVYGPGDGENTMVTSVIRQLLAGQEPSLSAGEQIWDYLYSKDAGDALYLIGDKGQAGKIYVLGSGEEVPLKKYAEAIRDAVDPGLSLGFGKIPYGNNQVMYLSADISQLTEDTGFVPNYSFVQGIAETVAWVREHEREKK